MHSSWEDGRRAFTDAAEWFVRTAASVDDRWDQPGLGEWDVRALVGHTSRSLLTVETYLARPAASVEIPSAADYYRATRAAAADSAVAARGRAGGPVVVGGGRDLDAGGRAGEVGLEGQQRAAGVADQRAHVPLPQPGLVPAIIHRRGRADKPLRRVGESSAAVFP